MSAGRKIIFGIITNILLFGILETTLRVTTSKPAFTKYKPVEFVANDFKAPVPGFPDRDLLWRMPPFAAIPGQGEKLNSYGFRGPEFTIEKPASTRRIICIGSTGVLGRHVRFNDTFIHRLSRWLATDKKYHFEVINLGLPSATIFQSLQVLRKEGLRLKPDIIIVGGGVWHDFTPAVDFDDQEAQEQMLKIENHKSGINARRLRFYQLICALFEKPLKPKGAEYRQLWSTLIQRPDGPRVSPAKFKKFLTTIAEEGKRSGAKIIFITPAATEIVKKRSPDSNVYAGIVNSVGITVADAVANTRVALEQSPVNPDELFLDDIHPSALGHREIAEEIAIQLQKLGIDGIPSTPPSVFIHPEIKLKELQKDAVHYYGDKNPIPVPADAAFNSDTLTLSLNSPNSIEFKKILIPAAASMEFDAIFFTRNSLDPTSPGNQPKNVTINLTYRVVIKRKGGGDTTVYSHVFEGKDENLWATFPRNCVDLSEFANETVNIQLCIDGWSHRASWGNPKITPCR